MGSSDHSAGMNVFHYFWLSSNLFNNVMCLLGVGTRPKHSFRVFISKKARCSKIRFLATAVNTFSKFTKKVLRNVNVDFCNLPISDN